MGTMDNRLLGIVGFFLIVNAVAFLVMWWDKVSSRRKDADRISEGLLFFMAVAFGSVGVWAGMFTFRHKTRKWYFILGIPLALVENCAVLYVAYLFLNQATL